MAGIPAVDALTLAVLMVFYPHTQYHPSFRAIGLHQSPSNAHVAIHMPLLGAIFQTFSANIKVLYLAFLLATRMMLVPNGIHGIPPSTQDKNRRHEANKLGR